MLSVDLLGAPSRGTHFSAHTYCPHAPNMLAPNPDGKTWDALEWYYKDYLGPTWLYAIDLGTGQVKKQRFPDGFQVHYSGQELAFDGKYYLVTPGPGGYVDRGGMFMFVYDPATNTLENRGEIVPGLHGELRPIVLGPDGQLYGTGTYADGRVGLYAYDPVLGKVVRNFGPIGPSHAPYAAFGYCIGACDTHAYVASGEIPWYLVAVNLETAEERVLLEAPPNGSIVIVPVFPGARAVVRQGDRARRREYWLYHGEAIPKVDESAPWPAKASPWEEAPPPPEIYRDQLAPDALGNATFWYRLPDNTAMAPKEAPTSGAPEDLGWRSIPLEGIDTHPQTIHRLALLPDGRLFGTMHGYVGRFLFDPNTDKAIGLGSNRWLSEYTHVVYGEKLYASGYWGGPIFVFDPKRPWTLQNAGPPGRPALRQDDPESNPRYLGRLHNATRVVDVYASAIGADGRIYFGGFGMRGYVGGGLGWYDPKTGELGGVWRPLSGYAVRWLAPMLDGRLMVMSTTTAPDELSNDRRPEEARLFVYDLSEGRIVREIVPVPKAMTTGLVIEVTPGRLLGLTVDPHRRDTSILYAVDMATPEILFRRTLPWPVSENRWYEGWDDDLDVVRGPDGFVWTYLRDVLVRIDPEDATVHVVGRIAPPGRPTFVGTDLYLTGSEQLRRIRSIASLVQVPHDGCSLPTPAETVRSFEK